MNSVFTELALGLTLVIPLLTNQPDLTAGLPKAQQWVEAVAEIIGDPHLFEIDEAKLMIRLRPVIGLSDQGTATQPPPDDLEHEILGGTIVHFNRVRKDAPATLEELDIEMVRQDPDGNPLYQPLRKALERRLTSPKWLEVDLTSEQKRRDSPNFPPTVGWQRGKNYPKYDINFSDQGNHIAIHVRRWLFQDGEYNEGNEEANNPPKKRKPNKQ